MTRSFLVILALLISAVGVVAGCSDEPAPVASGALEGINVRVAQPPGAENQALAALYAEAYAAAGAAVETEPVATPDAGLQAVTDGDADIYLDFAGRLYTDVLALKAMPDSPPTRIELAKAVTDRLGERGVTALNRAAYNAVTRVACTADVIRRTGGVNLSELAASGEPVRWSTTTDQAGDEGAIAELNSAYPKLIGEPDESESGAQFAKLRDGDADCALGPAGAPQISRFNLVPVADDLGRTLPNQAIALTNADFTLAAPDAFVEVTNRVTGILDDETVREINVAVQLDDSEAPDVARETLAAAGINAGS